MTKQYPIVHLGNEMYMIEEIKDPRKGDWVYEHDNNIPIYQFSYDMDSYPLPKILASSDKSLNLPLLPVVEDGLKLVGEQAFDALKALNPKGGMKEFIRMAAEFGYKAASAKKWSDEDMNKCFEHAASLSLNQLREKDWRDWRDEYLQSKPRAVEVEVDIFAYKLIPEVNKDFATPIYSPKVDENNFVKVIKWIYENS